MHRNNSKRKIVIYSLLGVLLLMTVGYASFQSSLKIKGTSKVSSLWDVEITNVTSGISIGSAENGKDENGDVILPTWDKLNASISADLYEPGDSMTYVVTIENKGTLDAKIDDIIPSQNSGNDNIVSNDGVKITFSGYTKGQMLYKSGQSGNKMDITVKVEYNDEYTGGPTSLETNLQFNFVQAESKEVDEGEVISENSHKVIYDYISNGGDKKTYERYYQEGEEIDLTIGTDEKYNLKKEYILLGWNTDGSSTEKLKTITMDNSDIHLYAIYKEDNIVINSINTTSTTNSITVVVDALADSGIKKIEYSNDDGDTWEESTEREEDNIHTINELKEESSYPIKIRVMSNTNKVIAEKIEDNLCQFSENNIWKFDYTGEKQNFQISCTGNYKIELWGAQGGNEPDGSTIGGKGAYTSGNINFLKGQNLYFYVGSFGGSDRNATVFNGGTGNSGGYNGGGATDVRLIDGEWYSQNSLISRIMVAGGGGSGKTPGAGGTLRGLDGTGTKGGTQTIPGAVEYTSYTRSYFGIANGGCSGGNGYYPGGGSACKDGSGGGSSYISGHLGCVAVNGPGTIALPKEGCNDGTNDIICSYHYSNKIFSDTKMIDGNNNMPSSSNGNEVGHSGNGYAKVTLTELSNGLITKSIPRPTFNEDNNGIVTITFPDECNSEYKCYYKTQNIKETQITNRTINLTFDTDDDIIVKINDGYNDISVSYVVVRNKIYIKSDGNDNTGNGTIINPYATLSKAYSSASTISPTTIYVMDNITQNNTTTMDKNKDITITSINSTVNSIIRANNFKEYLIYEENGELYLENITIDGNNIESSKGLIYIGANSNLNILSSTIKNNKVVDSNCGGAIQTYGNVDIHNGLITNNYNKVHNGGGICAYNQAVISFYSGTINYNSSLQGGGVMLYGGILKMSGGNISNNSAHSGVAGAVYVFNTNSKMEMTGGIITNNNAKNGGGGVVVECNKCNSKPSFILDGGIIKKNTAPSDGGIRNSSATYTYKSGYVCKNNSPTNSYDITAVTNSNCS